jgi:carboxypeptidase C (cathepsin A)
VLNQAQRRKQSALRWSLDMSKPVFFVFLCAILTSSAPSQTVKYVHVPEVEAQKLTAERETQTGSNFADMESRLQREQIARMVTERQAQLRRDTEKLVALTAELKAHVDKAGTNILSMNVIKKAAEIQKLAKSVEEKMKNAY